jgi:hypothetical protein
MSVYSCLTGTKEVVLSIRIEFSTQSHPDIGSLGVVFFFAYFWGLFAKKSTIFRKKLFFQLWHLNGRKDYPGVFLGAESEKAP